MNFKQEYFDCWRAGWELHKEFCNIQGGDEEWRSCINRVETIMARWEGRKQEIFVKALLCATLDEIERRSKETGKENMGDVGTVECAR